MYLTPMTSMKRSFLLFLFMIINNGCEQEKLVAPDTFSKMVSHRNLGLAYLEEERYTDAINEFTSLVQIAEGEPLGHANLGLTYLRMNGELKNSERALNNSLKLSPNNPDILFLLTNVYELTDREQ